MDHVAQGVLCPGRSGPLASLLALSFMVKKRGKGELAPLSVPIGRAGLWLDVRTRGLLASLVDVRPPSVPWPFWGAAWCFMGLSSK